VKETTDNQGLNTSTYNKKGIAILYNVVNFRDGNRMFRIKVLLGVDKVDHAIFDENIQK
jgi:hypothetical protein